MKQKDNKKDYSLTGNVNDNVNDNVNVNVNSLCSYRNSAISLQTSAIVDVPAMAGWVFLLYLHQQQADGNPDNFTHATDNADK